jgi:hypothetical protein
LSFAGYYTDINGWGARYYNARGERIFGELWDGTTNITLHAFWASADDLLLHHDNSTLDFEYIYIPDTDLYFFKITPPKSPDPLYTFQGYYTTNNGLWLRVFDDDGYIDNYWLRDEKRDELKSIKSAHALFERTNFMLVFEKCGGIGGTDNLILESYRVQRVGIFADLPVKVVPPTRAGFTFIGYFQDQDGMRKTIYNADGTTALYNTEIRVNQPIEDYVVYALWGCIICNNFENDCTCVRCGACEQLEGDCICVPQTSESEITASSEPHTTSELTQTTSDFTTITTTVNLTNEPPITTTSESTENTAEITLTASEPTTSEESATPSELTATADEPPATSSEPPSVTITSSCTRITTTSPKTTTEPPTAQSSQLTTTQSTTSAPTDTTNEPTTSDYEPPTSTTPAEIRTIEFNPNNGTDSAAIEIVNDGETIGELPKIARSGYEFAGWFTDLESEPEHYTIDDALEILKHIVKLPNEAKMPKHDLNGNGEFDIDDALIILKGIVRLIEPRVFVVDNGELILPDTQITQDMTLFARWRAIPPAVPTGFAAASNALRTATLTWFAAESADGYEVYRADTRLGTYAKIATINSAALTSYSDNGLTSDARYFYTVRAFRNTDTERLFSEYTMIIEKEIL